MLAPPGLHFIAAWHRASSRDLWVTQLNRTESTFKFKNPVLSKSHFRAKTGFLQPKSGVPTPVESRWVGPCSICNSGSRGIGRVMTRCRSSRIFFVGSGSSIPAQESPPKLSRPNLTVRTSTAVGSDAMAAPLVGTGSVLQAVSFLSLPVGWLVWW